MPRKPPFGGPGPKSGNAHTDLMGAVRRSPDQTMLAINWPSRPHPQTWAVTDCKGSLGYEIPERVAHWPVIGAVPGTPAAGQFLAEDPVPTKRVHRKPPAVVDVHLPAATEETESRG